jgi:predicted small metal-binding protein
MADSQNSLGAPMMVRQIRCECDYTARGDTDQAVINQVLAHLVTDHPELVGTETADDIRGWIELLPD